MKTNKTKNLKHAFVEQIILWIMLFIAFVGFLFFTIDYANALKVKDNSDAIGDYVARMISLDKPHEEIIQGVNNIKEDYVTPLTVDSLSCTTDNAVSNHQVIVNVYANLVNNFLPVGNDNVHSKTVVFNEQSEFEQTCTLNLSFN
jgi:Flp pilus assembly protein TadG